MSERLLGACGTLDDRFSLRIKFVMCLVPVEIIRTIKPAYDPNVTRPDNRVKAPDFRELLSYNDNAIRSTSQDIHGSSKSAHTVNQSLSS